MKTTFTLCLYLTLRSTTTMYMICWKMMLTMDLATMQEPRSTVDSSEKMVTRICMFMGPTRLRLCHRKKRSSYSTKARPRNVWARQGAIRSQVGVTLYSSYDWFRPRWT
uniref:Uncharacterized protein n=1 Tax=Cacopsylla melanoneura TaxID=428564 RepID=A0A8D8Z566_9HEMI